VTAVLGFGGSVSRQGRSRILSRSRRSFQKGTEEVAVGGRLAAWGWTAEEARTQVQTLCRTAWYWVCVAAEERVRHRLPWWVGGWSSKW
jgi:hypothetical protein